MEATGFFGVSVRRSEAHRRLVLAGIGQTLRSAFGRPRAMRSVIARTSRIVGADSGSVFLFEHEGSRLRRAYGLWDVTRASFLAEPRDWPSVGRAIALRRPIYLTRRRAGGGENEWFERGGIAGCLCAPLAANGTSYGIVFLDFLSKPPAPSRSDRKFARAVATSWVSAIVAAADVS